MKKLRDAGVGVGVVLLLGAGVVWAQETNARPPVSVKAEYQTFDVQWHESIQKGDPEGFRALMTNSLGTVSVSSWNDVLETPPTNKHSYYPCKMNLSHVYVTRHLVPWITFVDYYTPVYDVVPGGLINVGDYQSWFVYDGESTQKPKIAFTGATPQWQFSPAYPVQGSGDYGSSSGWWRGEAGGRGGQATWLSMRCWINVPPSAAIGSTTLALHEVILRPWADKTNEAAAIQVPLNVVKQEVPTREQVFCLWQFGLELGQAYKVNTGEETRATYQPIMKHIDSLLRRYAATTKSDAGRLAESLRNHPEYTTLVIEIVK